MAQHVGVDLLTGSAGRRSHRGHGSLRRPQRAELLPEPGLRAAVLSEADGMDRSRELRDWILPSQLALPPGSSILNQL